MEKIRVDVWAGPWNTDKISTHGKNRCHPQRWHYHEWAKPQTQEKVGLYLGVMNPVCSDMWTRVGDMLKGGLRPMSEDMECEKEHGLKSASFRKDV